MMTDLSENCELQTLINLTTYAPLLDAWHQVKKTADPMEAEVLLARILDDVFEAELRGQPLFRSGAGETWHLSLTNLKAEYGLRKMVGVPVFSKQAS